MLNHPKIGVVGPCAAGKSTLVSGLKRLGYNGKIIAQEHSFVADMWLRLTNPDVLVYLHVSYPTTLIRRHMNWSESEYTEQLRRLHHARENAHLIVDTDPLNPQQVLQKVVDYLDTKKFFNE